jgi:hypothetical protein
VGDPFSDGFFDPPGSKDVPRLPSEKVQYEMGRRVRGRRTPRAVTPQDVEEAKGWLRWSLRLALVGAVAGCGYGLWQVFAVSTGGGFGSQAFTVLEWTGIGAVGGAVLPFALVAALGLGLLAAILWGLGQLLNLLTSS